ncbi:MAG: nucleotidyl transferase AbiEii/AbiGii toxin family protein [Microgenomates group bacterium]|nr:nucleotidyl transferase AbiEii/AbiGii toxin family protein [Microgenomates group bacterium]
MAKSLLSVNQKQFLSFFSSEKKLNEKFYFTGGTALSEYYLQHRYSEDLDFFSEEEINAKDITLVIQSNKNKIKYKKIDYQNPFNRNIYQLIYSDNKILKVEFTYFPFKQIEKPQIVNNIAIDSLIDIAVNKIFTIYQNPRGRDFYDLYFIQKKHPDLTISRLKDLARLKFDFHIDYLQLGSNLAKVVKLKDDPILKSKIKNKEIQKFFLLEAAKLKDKIIKD